AGYRCNNPLELADGRILLVNRGFVPFDNKEPEMRMQGQLTDQKTVTGLAREKLPGKPSWVVTDNDVAKNIFYWKDLDV
ncbi:SURF1 family cytochrome oxidase biogenesis protein, partial [Rhizobium ruizarguesonis]